MIEPLATAFALAGAYLITEEGLELAGFWAFLIADVIWTVHFLNTGQWWPAFQSIAFAIFAAKGAIKNLTPLAVEGNNSQKVREP